MGVELRAVLNDGTESNVVVVPERIIGIERDTWGCFSDRPRRNATYENDFLGGCGGWASGTVLKWDPDESVRVWPGPSGDPRYIRILEQTLGELAPLLNLEIEWVETEAEATLKAYVGVPSTTSREHRPRRLLPRHGWLRGARLLQRWCHHARIHERLAGRLDGSPTD